ncbi:MAG: hypothetical protein K2X81_04890 [Candidatus Obscuribacterales bacterium]|nr:hypothetical protein [Candidatus Obscuribacterales bacterium]
MRRPVSLTSVLLSTVSMALFSSPCFAYEVPPPWVVKGDSSEKYEVKIDPSVIHNGKPSAFISSKEPKIEGMVTIRQKISAEKYLGKRVQFSCWLKTENVKEGALLWMRVDAKDNNPLAFDNMENRPVKGSTDWKQYSVVLNIPEGAKAILFGVWLSETGKVWANNLEFRVVGNDVPVTDLMKKEDSLAGEPSNMDFSEKK